MDIYNDSLPGILVAFLHFPKPDAQDLDVWPKGPNGDMGIP